MGAPGLGPPLKSGRRRYLSRSTAAAAALVLHGMLVYVLFRELDVVRLAEPPTVEPILVSLILQPRSLPTESRLPAMKPDLITLRYHSPDEPPDFRIEVPVEARAPQNTEPQLDNGAPSPRGSTEEPGQGGGVAVIRHVEPVYSLASVTAHEHGVVEVRVLVDEQGRPNDVRLLHSSGFARLDESALHAVRKYRFTRVVEGLRPVRFWTTVQLEFDLLPMPVPMTLVEFDASVAEQIAAAKHTRRGQHPEPPYAEAALGRLVSQLLEALSTAQLPTPDVQSIRSPPTPTQLLAAWGELRSVRFLGFANRPFETDLPPGDGRPLIGSRIPVSAPRCEIFEVTQIGGTSYWLAIVGGDGTLKRVQITAAPEPLSATGEVIPRVRDRQLR